MERRDAEAAASSLGLSLDEGKHPDLGGAEGFGPKFLGKVLVDSMDFSAYYGSNYPYFRSAERAKEQTLAFFEGRNGKVAGEAARKALLENADKAGVVYFVGARDAQGKKACVVVDAAKTEDAGVDEAPKAGWKPDFK